jgi:hypothetical protein
MPLMVAGPSSAAERYLGGQISESNTDRPWDKAPGHGLCYPMTMWEVRPKKTWRRSLRPCEQEVDDWRAKGQEF